MGGRRCCKATNQAGCEGERANQGGVTQLAGSTAWLPGLTRR